jgi:gas vesicle protein
MRSGNILLGALAGVAIGATLGILFAPARGASTRRKIARKSDAYAHELGEKFNDFIGGITGKFETFMEETISLSEDVKDQAEAAAETVEAGGVKVIK